MPPPTPKRPLKTPARVPIAASFSSRVRGHRLGAGRHAAILDAVPRESETGEGAWAALLEPLRADPSRAAILTDVDGTLAPIAARAEEAAVPAAARQALERLSERFGLVGCVSGRQAEEARRLVGLDGIAYAGNHGLELLLPGDEAPRPDPSLAGRETEAADFLAGLDPEPLARGGPAAGGQGPDPGAALARRRGRGARRGPRPRDRRRGRPRRARTALGPQGAGAAPGRRRRQGRRGRLAAGRRAARPPPSTPATTAPTSTPSAACASCARRASWRPRSASASSRPRRRRSCPRSPT